LGQATARSRGTVYVGDLEDNGQGRITVLEGSVEVSNAGGRNQLIALATPQSVVLIEGQAVDISATGEIGKPFAVSCRQLEQIASPVIRDFQQPLPDLEKIKIPLACANQGFADTFLQDAIAGGDSFERDDILKGNPSSSFVGTQTPGTLFFRGGNLGVAGFFFPAGSTGFTSSVTPNFPQGTLEIQGVQGVGSSLGFSGNNALGTVLLQNGQAIQLQIFGVGGQVPIPGQSFPATLSAPGRVRDR
jgi:hypothetical protein